jgi:hypothetical protein
VTYESGSMLTGEHEGGNPYQCAYGARFARWLGFAFPHANHTVVNFARGGAATREILPRLNEYMDLLQTVSDATDALSRKALSVGVANVDDAVADANADANANANVNASANARANASANASASSPPPPPPPPPPRPSSPPLDLAIIDFGVNDGSLLRRQVYRGSHELDLADAGNAHYLQRMMLANEGFLRTIHRRTRGKAAIMVNGLHNGGRYIALLRPLLARYNASLVGLYNG